MKLIYLGLGLVAGTFALIHVASYFLNRGLRLEIETNKTTTLAELRIEQEKIAKLNLSRYRWIDERKEYAEIPLERAFDYYLRRVRP